MNMWRMLFFVGFLGGCAVAAFSPQSEFVPVPITAGQYEIATWQKVTDKSPSTPVHIYIEGDGHAFRGNGRPSSNPTPRGDFVRRMAMRDVAPNVIYMARPCQFIMSPACTRHDWTDGRFSPAVIDAMAAAIKSVAGTRPVVLVGYSGGAMVSGLVILEHPEINVTRWITVAGVLNHSAWTEYFGDSPLTASLDMTTLPVVPQVHYVGARDKTVPPKLTGRIARATDIIIVPNATHDNFGELNLFVDK